MMHTAIILDYSNFWHTIRLPTFLILAINAFSSTEAIVGGQHAAPGQFKYVVSVQSSRSHRCGGAILDDFHVVTIGHCAYSDDGTLVDRLFVVVTNLSNLYESENNQITEIEVEFVFFLRYFDPTIDAEPYHIEGDITVLKLKDAFNLSNNENVMKLELPEEDILETDRHFVVAGYGYSNVTIDINLQTGLETEYGEIDGILRFGNAVIITKDKCNEMFEDTIGEFCMCVQMVQGRPDQPKGICTGDSGSPLVYNQTIVGIVHSAAFGCAENQYPSIYLKVYHYIDFIKSVLNNKITSLMEIFQSTEISLNTYKFMPIF